MPRQLWQQVLTGLFRPMTLVAMVDLVIACFAFWSAAWLRAGFQAEQVAFHLGPVLPRAIVFAGLLMLCMASMGMYRARQRPRSLETLLRVVLAVAVASTAFVLFIFIFPGLSAGRGVVALSMMLAAGGLTVGRLVMLRFLDWGPGKRRVLVVGSGEMASSIGMLRRRSDRRRFQVVGYVPMDEAERRFAEQAGYAPLIDDIGSAIDNQVIDEIVVAVDRAADALPTRELLRQKTRGIRITDVVEFLEYETGKIDLDVMEPQWLIFADSGHTSPLYRVGKRALDVVASLAIMLVTLPLTVFVYVAIKVEGGWSSPAFFTQPRVGRLGRPFELYKFRSMVVNADSSGAQWSSRGSDARVTSVGRLIRRFRADELPQLVNVLRGDMSLVGPRPEQPSFVESLAQAIPFYDYRHSVRPGLTGWAQLNFPYGESEEDARTKLKYDLYYINNASLLLDVSILLQTMEVVVWGHAMSMTGPGGPRLDPAKRRDHQLFQEEGVAAPGGDKRDAA